MPAWDGRVPNGRTVEEWGEECLHGILDDLEAGDWHGAYEWTKSWIGYGGGAWILDTWLLYAAGALGQGQPRTALHSLDMALGTWLPDPADRAVLLCARGQILRLRLNDPKTALADLTEARETAPDWLVPLADEALAGCAEEAPNSRKRVPSYKPRPDPPRGDRPDFVAPPVGPRVPGEKPGVWQVVLPFLTPAD